MLERVKDREKVTVILMLQLDSMVRLLTKMGNTTLLVDTRMNGDRWQVQLGHTELGKPVGLPSRCMQQKGR